MTSTNNKPDKVTVACKECGSGAILADAWAQWDILSQQWVLAEADLGMYWCSNCDGETKDPEFPRLDVVEAMETLCHHLETDEVMPTPVQFICGYCQSTAIRFDADVEWDADNQTMSVVTTYDHRECSDCSSTDVKVQTFIKRVEEA